MRFFATCIFFFICFEILDRVTTHCFDCGTDAYEVSFVRWACCAFAVLGIFWAQLLNNDN